MSRYVLRYIDIKEKSFNKEKTLKDFIRRSVFKVISVRKGIYLQKLGEL